MTARESQRCHISSQTGLSPHCHGRSWQGRGGSSPQAEIRQVWKTQDHSLSNMRTDGAKLWSSNSIRWHLLQLVKLRLLSAFQYCKPCMYACIKSAESTVGAQSKSPRSSDACLSSTYYVHRDEQEISPAFGALTVLCKKYTQAIPILGNKHRDF